jgi:hypothetical protein
MTQELRQQIRDYHEYHGDEHVRIVRKVFDDDGWPAVLVRIGDDVSCIDTIDDYIVELCSCRREDEAKMVRSFAAGTTFDFDED